VQLKDYAISGESFELKYNQELDLYETLPKPAPEKLPQYYESDDYISHSDGTNSFIERLYQIVKGITLRQKLKTISRFHNKGLVLDIGCGTGDFLYHTQKGGYKVVGVEPNEKARTKAWNKLGFDVKIFEGLKEVYSEFDTKSFDVITLWHVLEHVPDYNEYLQQIGKLLKDDGLLIIAVPNFKSYDAQYYQNYWAAYDVPRHLWHFSEKSINSIVKKHNMKVRHIKPMLFDAFYVSMLSEKYKTGDSRIIKAIFIGLLSNIKGIFSKQFSSHIYLIQKSEILK
jgi:SAM-dependent methyltransferase